MTALYKDGNRPKKCDASVEEEVYARIVDEFVSDFGSSNDNKSKINSLRRLETARLNVIILSCAIRLYGTDKIDEEVRKALKGLRVSITGDKERDMKVLSGRLSEATRKFKEANEDIERENSGGTLDEEGFYSLLVTMSSWFKFNIPNDITTKVFCSYYRKMDSEAEIKMKSMRKTQKNQKKSYGKR